MTDDLKERLRHADEYEPLGHDGWEALDCITDLEARLAAAEAERDYWQKDSAAAHDGDPPMTKTAHTAWQSPDGRAHIEERNGLLWCYIGENHVGTQLHLEAAIKLVRCKLEDDHG